MTLVKSEFPVALERDLNRMKNRLQRFFDEPFGLDLRMPVDDKRFEQLQWMPAVEATETPMEYLVTAELPGISPENVEVAVSDGVLTLKGHKVEDRAEHTKDRTFHLWERDYGAFQRTFRFPLAINEAKVTAEFTNGILKVLVPKVEKSVPASRTIPIAKK